MKTKGLRVAMTVYTEKEATIENSKAYKKNLFDNDALHEHFGYAENYNVYRGEILFVGEKHFEHNIKCFQGCAGAIIFLLDGYHAGTAAGVHVGSPESRESNLAFKLASVERPAS